METAALHLSSLTTELARWMSSKLETGTRLFVKRWCWSYHWDCVESLKYKRLLKKIIKSSVSPLNRVLLFVHEELKSGTIKPHERSRRVGEITSALAVK